MHDSQDKLALFNPIDSAAMRVSRAMHARSVDHGMRHAEDTLAFVQRRLAAHRRLVVALSAAPRIADQGRMWAEYCQGTMRDYAAQSSALSADMVAAIEMTIDNAGAAGKALRGRARSG